MTKKRRAWFVRYQWRDDDEGWTEEQTTMTEHPVRWLAQRKRVQHMTKTKHRLMFYREIDPDMHDEVKAVVNDD